jgi:protein CpxP
MLLTNEMPGKSATACGAMRDPHATVWPEQGFLQYMEKEHRMMNFAKQLLPARRTLVLAGALILSSGALVAQADSQATPQGNAPAAGEMGRHRPGVERRVKKLTQVLSLSSDQQAQVKAILVAQRQQMNELRSASPANGATADAQPAAREQFKSIHEATEAKINAVLNDEQKTKYAAWQQQRKQMMERRRGTPESAPPAGQGV